MKVLAHNGPLNLTKITSEANFNFPMLKEYLGFLIKQGLVEERTINKRSFSFRSHSAGHNCSEVFPGTGASATDHRISQT